MSGSLQTSRRIIDVGAQGEINRLLYWVSLLRKRIDDLTARTDVIESTVVATNHADLDNLDYDSSGHTGFQKEGEVPVDVTLDAVCDNGSTTDQSITIGQSLTLVSGANTSIIKINATTGRLEIWVNGQLRTTS